MNYSLAKELKDAGFPQEVKGGHLEGVPTSNETAEVAYFPTLSELIAACGEDFYELIRPKDEDGRWYATSHTRAPSYPHGIGNTPEEAVARLWLALNKVTTSTL